MDKQTLEMMQAVKERELRLTPEQAALRELVDRRNEAIQTKGLPQPASGTWGKV